MTQRAGRHRTREVCRKTRPRDHLDAHREDAASVVEADLVVVAEIMALAGDHHVVVAVEAQLDRTVQLAGRQRRDAGEQRRLALLATEAAAHSPHLDQHLVGRLVEAVRHHMLHLGRMLGGAPQLQATVLPRCAVGHLPLEVELLLPADRPLPLQAVRRCGQPLGGFAADAAHRRQHEGLCGARRTRVQHRWQHLVVDHRLARCPAGGVHRGGNHREDRLADIEHLAIGKDRIVMDDRTAIVGAWNVRRGEHRDHARHRPHRREIDGTNARPGLGRDAQRRVQGACKFGNVVHIGRRAGDMQVRGLVRCTLPGAYAGV